MKPTALLAIAAFVLPGCASIPDVAVRYYFPKAETKVQITQLIRCAGATADTKNTPVFTTSVLLSPVTYSSDRDMPPGIVAFAGVNKGYSDLDLSLSFTDDGRLTGINTTAAGQGSALIKVGIAVATALVPLRSAWATQTPRALDPATLCQNLVKFGDKEGNVTLTYVAPLVLKSTADAVEIVPDSNSTDLFHKLFGSDSGIGFAARITVDTSSDNSVQIGTDRFTAGLYMLQLNKVGLATITISGPDATLRSLESIFVATDIPVPLAEHYPLPIPASPFFGTSGFALTLSPAGAITKLQYSKKSAATDLADSAGGIAKVVEPPNATNQAADVKGQADLIVQQQRLIKCKQDPVQCT
jgi:hypothetical protein